MATNVTNVIKPRTQVEACRLVAEAASSWWAERLYLSEEKKKKRQDFKKVLFSLLLLDLLEKNQKLQYAKELLCTEGKEGEDLLYLAKEFAGIEDATFPSDVEMWISLKKIKTRGRGTNVFDEPETIIYQVQN